ncbi:hypothetical protein CCR97_09370 [Rhodoplanes elegans]|uniref:DUF4142 domain-containing protein n=1 Tax=Rhodoplanes elegans TaxID=29408 RepID=A0A327KWL3_9BRAD|nr:hypothetical protein [Rhodoplanes elegans]RAI42043.1 hypothetical protein CH338_01110 [Rhodoplanes elegans]
MITRRVFVGGALAGVAFGVLVPRFAAAQAPAPADPNAGAAAVLRLALSSARMQARVCEIVLAKDVRPELRGLAETIVAFRREQVPRLETVAREHGVAVVPVLEFEHQVALDNLAPLDFLALGRRFVELQQQALEQEITIWRRGQGAAEPWLAALAGEILPRIEALLADARKGAVVVVP